MTGREKGGESGDDDDTFPFVVSRLFPMPFSCCCCLNNDVYSRERKLMVTYVRYISLYCLRYNYNRSDPPFSQVFTPRQGVSMSWVDRVSLRAKTFAKDIVILQLSITILKKEHYSLYFFCHNLQ